MNFLPRESVFVYSRNIVAHLLDIVPDLPNASEQRRVNFDVLRRHRHAELLKNLGHCIVADGIVWGEHIRRKSRRHGASSDIMAIGQVINWMDNTYLDSPEITGAGLRYTRHEV
jgi:hypothetical protein